MRLVHVGALACALIHFAGACGRDAGPPPAAASARPALPRLARDTVVDRPRAIVWSAAMRAAAAAGYRLSSFDAAKGTAEFAQDSSLWLRLDLPRDAEDTVRTRLVVLASHEPARLAALGRPRGPAMPDDSAVARARSLLGAIASMSPSGRDANLLRDSATVPVGADTVEACRGADLGEWWVEIDHRSDPARCATPRLFGLERNVAIMQQVERLPRFALVSACSDRARVPRGFTVAYTMMDATRCRGAKGARANVLVLRKMF